VVALAVTCSALAIAARGSSTKSTTTPSSSALAAALKFAGCMRSHGVPNFPDPTSNVAPSNGAAPTNDAAPSVGTVDKHSPAVQAGAKACNSIAHSAPSAAQNVQRTGPTLKFAECMRSHGVTNFPDPTADRAAPTVGTIDKQSPAVQAAAKACGPS
jgi:hypothetical protein